MNEREQAIIDLCAFQDAHSVIPQLLA